MELPLRKLILFNAVVHIFAKKKRSGIKEKMSRRSGNDLGTGHLSSERNTNLHWNAVMEGVIRISHLIELVYSQKIPKKLVKKILWYYLVTIPNYV